jgi:hypothetical protein
MPVRRRTTASCRPSPDSTPVGVVGIVYSALAMEARSRGDIYAWESRVQSARTWTLWSIGIGVLVVVAVICLFLTNPELAQS